MNDMRKIKFRGFDTLSPKMYTGHSVSVGADGSIAYLDQDGVWKPNDGDWWIVMQWTGLTDKNGVEIYEGDIIRNWQGGWNVVVYKAPSFEATVSADQSSMYSLDWWQTVEVIGNIHENPELLKQ